MKDQQVVKAFTPHASQKAFTNRIGLWRVIRRFQYLNAARCCHSSETGSKLAVMIMNEILRRVSIRSRLPQLLSGPGVGRASRHTDMNDLPRLQFNDEKRKEWSKEQIGDL